jgi:hypothetical protein
MTDTIHASTREALAWISLAKTQRRISHRYRRWAAEAEQRGNLERYRYYKAKANELWSEAKGHLKLARNWMQ